MCVCVRLCVTVCNCLFVCTCECRVGVFGASKWCLQIFNYFVRARSCAASTCKPLQLLRFVRACACVHACMRVRLLMSVSVSASVHVSVCACVCGVERINAV